MRRRHRRSLLLLLSAVVIGSMAAAPPIQAAGTGGGCAGCTTVRYYLDSIHSTYDGSYDHGTGYGCVGPCTASFSESMSYAHTWGASMSFSKSVVDAEVSYSLSTTYSKQFTASFPVPSGKTGMVRYKDWYHVTKWNARKVTCGKTCTTTYGTAWAGQWFKRVFYLDT